MKTTSVSTEKSEIQLYTKKLPLLYQFLIFRNMLIFHTAHFVLCFKKSHCLFQLDFVAKVYIIQLFHLIPLKKKTFFFHPANIKMQGYGAPKSFIFFLNILVVYVTTLSLSIVL